MKGIKFKVFYKPIKDTILFKGYFEEYESFAKLVSKAIQRSKLGIFMDNKLGFSEKNKFLFTITTETEKIPKGYTTEFWDEETYKYIKERLKPANKSEPKVTYLLTIEKIREEKKWNPKPYEKIFKDVSSNYIKDLVNNIKMDLKNGAIMQDFIVLFKNGDKKDKKGKEIKGSANSANSANSNNERDDVNVGIICQNCFNFDFIGPRFVCAECPDYNLCWNCKSLLNKEHFHDEEHVFIQFYKPISNEIQEKILNNSIDKKIHYLKITDDKKEIKFKIGNNTNDCLDNCFIQPIRYGPGYLRCTREKIDKIKPYENMEIKLKLIVPKEEKKCYEGYFRMFSKEGLPFGDVVKVVIG